MVYGDDANKLLREAKRTTDNLPPYNDDTVRSVIRETRSLLEIVTGVAEAHQRHQQISGSAAPMAPESMAGLLVHHLSLRRNKRCLLAYHRQRIERIKEMAWSGGMAGGLGSSVPREMRKCMSTKEEEFFKGYAELGRQYGMKFTEVDVLVPTTALLPPKDLYITVRVLKDCGEILTESGAVTLKKNEEHFLKRTDVERLISQGFLKHVV